jgi:hypothetical protein
LISTETAHPAGDRGGDGSACRPVGDVERERFRYAAGGADRRHRLSGGVAVDIKCGDAGTLAGKAERDGAADPRTGAGHSGDVVMQKPRHVCVLVLRHVDCSPDEAMGPARCGQA